MNYRNYFIFCYQSVSKLVFVILCFIFLLGFGSTCTSKIALDNISQISMVRTPCYGKCPVYTVTFHKDGTAEYKGEAHVERIGIFDGAIADIDFQKLSNLIKSNNFLQMEKEYSAALDLPGVIVEVKMNGVVKQVRADSQAMPPALEEIAQTIDKIASKINCLLILLILQHSINEFLTIPASILSNLTLASVS